MPGLRRENCGRAAALIERSRRRAAGILDVDRLAGTLPMHALSARLTSKRLYIADLAQRLEAMENGKMVMNAIAYRLYARRIKAAIAVYPPRLLAAQLGRSHPAAMHALEQQQFEADGMMMGVGSGRALVAAAKLLRRLRRTEG
ncbi:MAG TPA: hypothetical protein VGI48_16620 [Caldimonas sp.]